MEFDNIIYINNFSPIGGTESFVYYLCRKYKDYDIAVIYNSGDENQINRLKKYVRVIKYNGQKIKCNVAIFNYKTDMADYIDAKEYIQIIHTDYLKQGLTFNKHPKINKFYGVSEAVCKSFKEYTGYDIELCYNPIILDKPKKKLKLVSATRLTKEKGRDRMEILGRILNQSGIPYVWEVYTNSQNFINNKNIFYKKPRLDIIDELYNADYLVQLSDPRRTVMAILLLKHFQLGLQ